MDIHEYQAKKILSNFGVTIPRGDEPGTANSLLCSLDLAGL